MGHFSFKFPVFLLTTRDAYNSNRVDPQWQVRNDSDLGRHLLIFTDEAAIIQCCQNWDLPLENACPISHTRDELSARLRGLPPGIQRAEIADSQRQVVRCSIQELLEQLDSDAPE